MTGKPWIKYGLATLAAAILAAGGFAAGMRFAGDAPPSGAGGASSDAGGASGAPTGSSAAVQPVPPYENNYRVAKTAMTHTDTMSFAWSSPRISGAQITDYLAPQLEEIFTTLGIETVGQYVIEEDAARRTPRGYRDMLRCFNILNRGKGGGIALLCYAVKGDGEIRISVQVVNAALGALISYEGTSDFVFADFDGDGMDEVFVTSQDYYWTTAGVFPFADGVWGVPLFWAVNSEGPRPYDFGFHLSGGDRYYTITNSHTGYARSFEVDNDFYYGDDSLQHLNIFSAAAADVDGDGICELLIRQWPYKWDGYCFSLLKYNGREQGFETIHAAYLLREEQGGFGAEDGFRAFLAQAGYDAENLVFLNALDW